MAGWRRLIYNDRLQLIADLFTVQICHELASVITHRLGLLRACASRIFAHHRGGPLDRTLQVLRRLCRHHLRAVSGSFCALSRRRRRSVDHFLLPKLRPRPLCLLHRPAGWPVVFLDPEKQRLGPERPHVPGGGAEPAAHGRHLGRVGRRAFAAAAHGRSLRRHHEHARSRRDAGSTCNHGLSGRHHCRLCLRLSGFHSRHHPHAHLCEKGLQHRREA